MPIDAKRQAFFQTFEESREATTFLQRLFKVRPGNQFLTETVHIDIVRSKSPVAIPVTPGSPTNMAGPRLNKADRFTNKEFVPADYNEGQAVQMQDVLKRYAGTNPFEVPQFRRDLLARIMRTSAQIAAKFVRAAELQASQVLQTGALDLVDSNGVSIYTEDFLPKATHLITAGVPWSTTTAPVRQDLLDMARVIRTDSGIDSKLVLMGEDAFENFLRNDEIKDNLNFRRADIISIAPQLMDSGATLQGRISIGNYKFEIWTYSGFFDHPDTGVATDYIVKDNVIMLSDRTRLDKLSSAPDLAIVKDGRLTAFEPGRLLGGEIDVSPHVWISENLKTLNVELAGRFVMAPTQIDGFARLYTGT